MVHKPTYEELEKRVAELEQQVGLQQVEGLHNSSEILSILFEAFKYIPQCRTFEDAATKIFEHCKKLTGALSGYVALLSENGEENEVLFLDAGGLPCDVDPNLPMPIRGLRERAYTTKSVAYDNAFAESPWMDFMPEGHVRLENVLFAPINIKDKTSGIIGIANKPGGFNEYDVYVAKILGDLAAVALTYANARDSQKVSEEHYRTLFDTINDSIFIHKILPNGEPGKFLQVNEAAATTLGYSIEELMSLSPRALDDPATSPQYIPKVIELLRKSGNARFEATQIAKDGSSVDVEVNAALTNIGGEEVIFSVCRDITERKKYQDYLEKYKNIVSSTLDGIAFLDENYRYIIVNDAYEKFSGVNREEFLGMTVSEYLGRDIFEKRIKPNFDTCLQGEVINYQDWFEYPKLGRRYVDVTYYPYRKSDGMIVGVVSNTRDITDRKEYEKDLKSLVHDQSVILNNIRSYIYFKDTENKILRISQAVADVTGLPKEQIEGVHSREIYPDMADDYWKDDLEVIHSGKPKLGIVEPLPLKNGQNRWLLTDKIPYFDEGGNVSGVIVIANDITDRIVYEKQLEANETKLNTIFQNNPAGIVISTLDEGRIIDCNESLEAITGYSKAELIGKKTVDTSFWTGGEEQREKTVDLLRSDGSFKNININFKTKRNEDRHGIFSAELVTLDNQDCIVTTMFDVTDLVKTKKELSESQEHYKILFERSHNAIFVVDLTTGRYLEANRAAEVLTGRSRDEIVKLTTEDITPKDAQNRLDKANQLKTTPDQVYEFKNVIYVRPDGSERAAVLTVVSGDGNQAFGIAQDITDQLKSEEQLRKAQRMESIGDLAGGIAHDFNNILAPIIGIAEMLIEDFPPGSPESENARQILKAGKRGSDLVKQILAFSRQSEHKMIPIRIQHILKEVLKLSRSTIPSYFEITQDIQPDCGMILGDPSQIHQVVMNVITNAFHAIEDTGGSISVTLSQKVLLGEEIGDVNPGPRAYAVIHISDTGHGMREELIGKIFDPYFTTKEQGKGTGLGLAVVYGIVKEHGGGIKVASEIGKGSVFEIYLPLMEELRLSESSKGSEEIQGGNERILLVDDEESIANLQQRMLERLGYKATSRISSIEALELFRAKPHSFDLVISDLSMPHMPGDLFSAELRAIRPGIPIIICTGFSERVREDTIQKMGINGLLMKPILKSELAKIVRKVLDEAR